jgi:hypothetical protein
MLKVLPSNFTLELLGRVPSGVIWALAQFTEKASVCDTTALIAILNNQRQRLVFQPDIALSQIL